MAYLHLVSTQRKAGQTVLHSWNAFIAWTFPEFFRMSLTISCFCLLKVAHHSMSNVSFTSILPSHTHSYCVVQWRAYVKARLVFPTHSV